MQIIELGIVRLISMALIALIDWIQDSKGLLINVLFISFSITMLNFALWIW